MSKRFDPSGKDDVKLSKSLSWLLRHGALKEGLSFDEGGFIDVGKILNLKQFCNYTQADILRIVADNDKKRFSTRYSDDGRCLKIRANQGHSLPIQEEGLLTLLTDETLPPVVYHGTYFSNLQNIKLKGLLRMNRNHIHFVSKFPGEPVISGMRQNSEIVIAVDASKASKDGFKFYVSDNEVILSPGNDRGAMPSIYFKEIWQLKPLKRLDI